MPILLGNHGRRLGRIARPVPPKSPVVLRARLALPAVQERVEDDRAVGAVLGDLARRAPVHQGVAAGQDLHRPLRLGKNKMRRLEDLSQAHAPVAQVQLQYLAGRAGACRVVEQGYGALVAGNVARVMLPRERRRLGLQGEIRLQPA